MSLEQALKCNPCLNFYLVELFFKASTKTLRNGYFYSQTEKHSCNSFDLVLLCLFRCWTKKNLFTRDSLVSGTWKKLHTEVPRGSGLWSLFHSPLNNSTFSVYTKVCSVCPFLYFTISFCWRMGSCPKLTFRILLFNGCIQLSCVSLKSLL